MLDWQTIVDTAELHVTTGNSIVGVDLQALTMPISVSNLRQALQKKEPVPLSQLLSGTRFRLSTDPRDKVYAVSQLAADSAGRDVKVSYQTTAHQLYVRTAYDILQSEANLDLLSIPKGPLPIEVNIDAAQGIGDLPSWVMDWRTISNVTPLTGRKFERIFALAAAHLSHAKSTWLTASY